VRAVEARYLDRQAAPAETLQIQNELAECDDRLLNRAVDLPWPSLQLPPAPCSRTTIIKEIVMNPANSIFKILILVVAAALLATACDRQATNAKPDDVDYYTCAMHPSVRSQDPNGKCPICSMNLVPVMKKSAAGTNVTNAAAPMSMGREEMPQEFTVPMPRQQQIGVTYAMVGKRSFGHTILAAGVVAYDEQRHWGYVARVEGFVDQLSVFSRGERVEKDGPLLTLYSQSLMGSQGALVDLLKAREEARMRGNKPILESAELTQFFLSRIPVGRWGKPEEIGQLAAYLCSESAGFITGTDIIIDGGWIAQ
jgi:hypothetical protein